MLSIRRLILHVVGEGGQPFKPEPEIADLSSAPFFCSRIQDMASAAVHAFNPNSATKATLEKMASNANHFVAGAQALAQEFSRQHVETSVSGAFFVFEVGTPVSGTLLYALMKYDYRAALELTELQGQPPVLRNIVHAFVTESRAIQKSCLVRVVGGVAQDAISAVDRMGRGSDITDYFARFLDVRRSRSDEELNRSLLEVIRNTLKAVLPKEAVLAGFDAATAALRNRAMITDEAIREALFVGSGSPTDETMTAKLDREATRQLNREALTKVDFRPSPDILSKKPRRRLETVEGVQITYPGSEESRAVKLERQGDGWRIVVTSAKDLVTNANIAIKAG